MTRIIKISPSGLNSIQSCFRYSYYHRVLGYDPPGENENFVRGNIIHSMLELYYNNVIAGKVLIENIKESITLLKELLSKTNIDQEDKQAITNSAMEYFGFYANDLYKPLKVETPFSYELYEDENVKILLEGKLDLVTEREQGDGEKLSYVFDHKSRKKDSTPSLLQNQYQAYALATGIPNVVDNQFGLQTSKKPADKFKRRVYSYTKEQLDEFAEWSIYWVLMFDTAIQRNHFPPNYTSCYSCDFAGVCESNKEFRQEKLERFFVKRETDFDIFGEKK